MNRIFDRLSYFWGGSTKLLCKKIKRSECQAVCIYGAGEIGSELLQALRDNSIPVHSVVDRIAEFIPKNMGNIQVEEPATLADISSDVAVVIASEAFLDEMKQRVIQETKGKSIEIIHV